jgi:hypothetical protein
MVWMIGILMPGNVFAQTPTSARIWMYGNLTTVMHPNIAYVIMPGFRYEFARDDEMGSEEKGLYFYELLTGPVFGVRLKNSSIKLPLWYYYMDFPVRSSDDHYFSHNIELLPIITLRCKPVVITSRTIFHNTLYASVYGEDTLNSGYGLVLRQLVRLDIPISKAVIATIGEEPFFGIIEDAQAPPHPLGFWERGFRMNRVYIGCIIRPFDRLSVSPQHVYETTYDSEGTLTARNHYFFLTISYTLQLQE